MRNIISFGFRSQTLTDFVTVILQIANIFRDDGYVFVKNAAILIELNANSSQQARFLHQTNDLLQIGHDIWLRHDLIINHFGSIIASVQIHAFHGVYHPFD